MLMNIKPLKFTLMALSAAAVAFASCENSGEDVFENMVYIEDYESSRLLYVSTEPSYTESVVAAIPRPAEKPVNVRYAVDESLVADYNLAHGANAVILPSEIWSLSSENVTINAGDVRSEACEIRFTDVLSLDKDSLYVLPFTIASADIDILDTRSTKYYVFEGANLINVVGYMYENYCTVNWNNPAPLTNMGQVTIEMLMNCDWARNKDEHSENNSFFGVEGYFLFRTGDLSNPVDLLQMCSNGGGEPPMALTMPTDKWFHLACTYDCSTRQMDFYLNGEYVPEASGKGGNYGSGITFAREDFHINTAYNGSRHACAMFSEVRIWNRVLSAEEIADPVHPYYVDPSSDGLVAYWKFNDAKGNVVADCSGNGNDAVAANVIDWRKVALPEVEKDQN